MKHGKIISIRDHRLKSIVVNLRGFICNSVYSRRKYNRERIEELVNSEDNIDRKQINKLQAENYKLRRLLKNSICLCGYCNVNDKDMIYHAGWGMWWCLECFEREKEATDPKRWFNKGVVVNKNATKPCWFLDWCPYGPLVENFRIRTTDSDYTCKVFDHDCPVFYVSERITEESDFRLPYSTKLKDNLRNCRGFNDKKPIVHNIEKPCNHDILYFCPYGSLGDKFQKRDGDFKYGCNIFPHDCPAFYHAEKIREPPLF